MSWYLTWVQLCLQLLAKPHKLSMHCPGVTFHTAVQSGGKESKKINNSEYQDLRIRLQDTHFHMFKSWKRGFGFFGFFFHSLLYNISENRFFTDVCESASQNRIVPLDRSALTLPQPHLLNFNPRNSLETRQGSTSSFSKHPQKTPRRSAHCSVLLSLQRQRRT